MNIDNKIKEILYECDKHKEKIIIAKQYLKNKMPLTLDKYQNLDDIEVSFIDQLVFRFSKLQDTLGEKTFPAILTLTMEEIKRKTFIDILNRLEELELVDKTKWLILREIRNDIAHEYSFNTTQIIAGITDIYNHSEQLINIHQTLKKFLLSQEATSSIKNRLD